MTLIIDGYNLILHEDWPKSDGLLENKRASLISILSQYRKQAGIGQVVVVFDGFSPQNLPSHVKKDGIEIYYQGDGGADNKILQLAHKIKPACVVTSDRALGESVKRCGGKVMTAPRFIAELNNPHPSPACPPDELSLRKPPSKEEIDKWLKIFGIEESIKF